MVTREFDPLRLEVQIFARESGRLQGQWPLALLDRAAESALPAAAIGGLGDVTWSARGEARPQAGAEAQTWLHVKAGAQLPLECQRCLQPVTVRLAVDRSFLFVRGEEQAAQADTDSEDDVLVMTRALDLRALIEDELLLALPIVPRHELCPVPLQAEPAETIEDEKPNPFAALAALRRGTPLN